MNALDPINLSIEFVKQTVDPGGGGEVVNAQTGDIAIWSILAIVFVGIIAYCMFKFSRVFNGEYATATASPKHAKNAHRGGRLATTKAVLIAAVVGLIACLSITTTTAFAQSQKNSIDFKPDKIQVVINEETGEAFCDAFNFVNNTSDYYLFTNSSLSLTEVAEEVSTPEDWDVTLNAPGLNAFLFNGAPGDYTIDYNAIQTLYPGGTSSATFTFNKFDKEIAKQLIGKQVFTLSLTPADNIVKVPTAETGLVYDGSEKVGVIGGAGYTLTGNTGTNAGDNYLATATLDGAELIWPDKTKAPKQIPWSIRKADGAFDTYPTAKTLTYSGENQALVEAGTDSYGASVVYKIEGGEYSTNIPVATDAKNYVVYAHVLADDNHFQSPDYVVDNAYIAQNVIESITIQGSVANKDYKEEGQYTFPYYGGGEKAYKVTSYTLKQPAAAGLVSAEKITPNDHGDIPAITVDCFDIGSHELNLQGFTWKYNDSNIIANADTVWDVHNGNLQINEQKAVQISITASPEKAKIGEKVTYKVTLTNKTESSINDGELQINTDQTTKITDIDLPDQDPVERTMEYTVQPSDFLYPSLVNVITYSVTIDSVPYIVYDSVSTAFDYKIATAPVVPDSYYTGEPHKPFEGTHEGYDIVVGGGSIAEATNAGTYTTLIVLQPGYHWNDSSTSIYKLVTWTIKPIDVLIHFNVADSGYTTTYGSEWTLPVNAITYTATQQLPATKPTLKDILGADPTSECLYKQGDYAGEYTVSLNLPAKSGWNSNYSISSKNSKLTVGKKTLVLTWQSELTYTGKIQYPNINYSGQYGQDEISFDIKAYSDSEHSQEVQPVEPNTYFCVATIKGSINQRNYKIFDGQDEAEVVIKPSPTGKTPKAVLTEALFDSDYTLNIVYDDRTYEAGKGGVVAWYEITENTSFSPLYPASAKFPPWHDEASTLSKVNKVVFNSSFAQENIYFRSGSKLERLDCWFADMPNLYRIENTENIISPSILKYLFLNGMFYNSGSNTNSELDLSKFNLEGKCISISAEGMFKMSKYKSIIFPENKKSLALLDDCLGMFESCVNLETIVNGDFYISSGNQIFMNMFKDCSSLKTLDITNWAINVHFNFDDVFNGCSSLERISCNYDTNWATGYTGSSHNMFKGCTSLPHFEEITAGASDIDINFAKGCNSTNYKTIKGLFSEPEPDAGKATIINGTLQFYVEGQDDITPTSDSWKVPLNAMSYFDVGWHDSPYNDVEFTENFRRWFVKYITSLNMWFTSTGVGKNNCEYIDLSVLDTRNIVSMNAIFLDCKNLKYVDISGWSTSNVSGMSQMFCNCNNLLEVKGIANINVSNVKLMESMFENCYKISYLLLNDWNTSKLQYASSMFKNCTSLSRVDIRNWDISSLIKCDSLFEGCQYITSIWINGEGWNNPPSNADMSQMFYGCFTLKYIYCNGDWREKNITSSNMFYNCATLPNFSSSKVDKSMAFSYTSGGYFRQSS